MYNFVCFNTILFMDHAREYHTNKVQTTSSEREIWKKRINGFLWQPVLVLLERFFAGEDFHPRHTPLTLVRAFYGGIEDADGCAPNVRAPVPSPSTNGMIGLCGTESTPALKVIPSPRGGTFANLYFVIGS